MSAPQNALLLIGSPKPGESRRSRSAPTCSNSSKRAA